MIKSYSIINHIVLIIQKKLFKSNKIILLHSIIHAKRVVHISSIYTCYFIIVYYNISNNHIK